MYKYHLTSNHQRNQKQGTDSSSLPAQNDIRPLVILSGAKNLISGKESLNDKNRLKELVVTGERFFVVPPQNDTECSVILSGAKNLTSIEV